VLLTIGPRYFLSARLGVEGIALTAVPDLSRTRLQLIPSRDGAAVSGDRSVEAYTADTIGMLIFPGVVAGEYLVRISGLPEGFYVKTALFDRTDALRDPIRLSGSDDVLEIVLSPRSGRLHGVVIDQRSRPVPNAQAVLVPNVHRNRPDFYRIAVTDQNGQFTIAGIPPDDYKLFAWEAIEQFAFFDPDLLRRDEPQARAIRISESAIETVEVTVIPAAN
jgi:hypothetical protein